MADVSPDVGGFNSIDPRAVHARVGGYLSLVIDSCCSSLLTPTQGTLLDRDRTNDSVTKCKQNYTLHTNMWISPKNELTALLRIRGGGRAAVTAAPHCLRRSCDAHGPRCLRRSGTQERLRHPHASKTQSAFGAVAPLF